MRNIVDKYVLDIACKLEWTTSRRINIAINVAALSVIKDSEDILGSIPTLSHLNDGDWRYVRFTFLRLWLKSYDVNFGFYWLFEERGLDWLKPVFHGTTYTVVISHGDRFVCSSYSSSSIITMGCMGHKKRTFDILKKGLKVLNLTDYKLIIIWQWECFANNRA